MTRPAPSASVRRWTTSTVTEVYRGSEADRGAAAAGRLDVRVVELEPGALQTLDVVDLGAHEVHEAHLIDVDLDPVDLELAVHLGLAVEVEVVREARAAAADDAQAQPHLGLDPLGLADLEHLV